MLLCMYILIWFLVIKDIVNFTPVTAQRIKGEWLQIMKFIQTVMGLQYISVVTVLVICKVKCPTLCPKKTCDYIFYNNFNNKCSIAIIFGIVSSMSMRHRKMDSFPISPIQCNYLTLGNHRTKNDQFCRKQHIVLWINNVKQYFIYT